MNKVFKSLDDCCGCTACASICPKKAIEMQYDDCGFSYPHIDQLKCVDCGLCITTCSFTKKNENTRFRNNYVFKHGSEAVINESRSGGFFTAISDIVLSEQGIVYGALLDRNLFVKHVRATNKNERDRLRKSKYVQSNLDGIFEKVASDLQDNRTVLFTGTGCQCDGLKGYLKAQKINMDKLILCDIVCHSNASPKLFEKYLKYQSERFGSKIVEFYFRDKEKHSWMEHVEKIVFESGKVFYTDEYTNLFFADDIRPSCYNCKYTSLNRCGDLTIADCWGGQNVYPDIVDNKGASLVLVNTDKGEEYFKKACDKAISFEIPIEKVMQPRLQEPEKKSLTYDNFWQDYKNMPFGMFMKKYGHNNYSTYNLLISKIKKVIRLPFRVLKSLIKRVKV